jgi:hypothetical protein
MGDHCADPAASTKGADPNSGVRAHPASVVANARSALDTKTKIRIAANSGSHATGNAATNAVAG